MNMMLTITKKWKNSTLTIHFDLHLNLGFEFKINCNKYWFMSNQEEPESFTFYRKLLRLSIMP